MDYRATSTMPIPAISSGGQRRPDNGLAAIPFDPQPVLAHRREMCAARNEGHIRPGLGERGAIGPADTAGDAHPLLLRSRSARSSEAVPWPIPARAIFPHIPVLGNGSGGRACSCPILALDRADDPDADAALPARVSRRDAVAVRRAADRGIVRPRAASQYPLAV